MFKICHKCKSRIEDYGCESFDLVCQIYYCNYHNEPVFIDSDDPSTWKKFSESINFLEKKKIIISSEHPNSPSFIQLQIVENYRECDDEQLLCWCED